MPVVDGVAFLDAFRSGPRSACSVVFVMTALSEGVAESLRGRRVHAIWRKPFDVVSLVETVREVAHGLARAAPSRSPPYMAVDERLRTRPG